jgi:ABC-type nickel/cobalt efflux system permease component RcnA
MDNQYLSTIISTGFAVAFAHAALPTHWLPFVLAARAQHWSRARTVAVVAVAGGAHVIFTTLLGALIVWLGIEISHELGEIFLMIASGVLVLIGLFYLWRQFNGRQHEHHHSLSRLWSKGEPVHHHDGHDHNGHDHSGHTHDVHEHRSDRIAIGSLVSLLTFSPCESFLPVYLSGVPHGWSGFAALSLTLAIATLGSMIGLTWLTSFGMERIRLTALDRYENLIVGTLLVLLGGAVYLFEH